MKFHVGLYQTLCPFDCLRSLVNKSRGARIWQSPPTEIHSAQQAAHSAASSAVCNANAAVISALV